MSSTTLKMVVVQANHPSNSLLHGWSFWKEVMARYKKRWLARQLKEPCARCGYVQSTAEAALPHSHSQPSNTFAYAGPSAEFGRANVLTPETPESTMEQGLLIGSDCGSDYGSVDRPEPTLEQPQEVVVGKGKKKKAINSAVGKIPDKKEVE